MTISATDILVPVCSKIPLLYLLTQKVAQKFGYVLGIKEEIQYVFFLFIHIVNILNHYGLKRNHYTWIVR